MLKSTVGRRRRADRFSSNIHAPAGIKTMLGTSFRGIRWSRHWCASANGMARLIRSRRRCLHASNICVITNQKRLFVSNAHTRTHSDARTHARTALGARITHKLHSIRDKPHTPTHCTQNATYYGLEHKHSDTQPLPLEDMSECSRAGASACACVCYVLCAVCLFKCSVCLVLGDSAHASLALPQPAHSGPK